MLWGLWCLRLAFIVAAAHRPSFESEELAAEINEPEQSSPPKDSRSSSLPSAAGNLTGQGIGADSSVSAIQIADEISILPSLPTAGANPAAEGIGAAAKVSAIQTADKISSLPSLPSAGSNPAAEGIGAVAKVSAIQTADKISTLLALPSAGSIHAAEGIGAEAKVSAMQTADKISSLPSLPSAGAIPEAESIGAEDKVSVIQTSGKISSQPSLPSAGAIPAAQSNGAEAEVSAIQTTDKVSSPPALLSAASSPAAEGIGAEAKVSAMQTADKISSLQWLPSAASNPEAEGIGAVAKVSAIQTADKISTLLALPSAGAIPEAEGIGAAAKVSAIQTADKISSLPAVPSAAASPAGKGSDVEVSAIQTADKISIQPSVSSAVANFAGQGNSVAAKDVVQAADNVSSLTSLSSAAEHRADQGSSAAVVQRMQGTHVGWVNQHHGEGTEASFLSSATGGIKASAVEVSLQSSVTNGSTGSGSNGSTGSGSNGSAGSGSNGSTGSGSTAATLPGPQISSTLVAQDVKPTYEDATVAISANESNSLQLQRQAAELSGLLATALAGRNLTALQTHLANITSLLHENSTLLNVNQPLPVAMQKSTGERPAVKCSALGTAARAGWLSGANVMVDWDRGREDAGTRLDIAAGGCSGDGTNRTNLQLAQEANASQMVQFFAEHNSSVMIRNAAGLTPLEVAVRQGSLEMASALLNANGSELHGSLLRLRLQLSKAAEDLPYLVDWWPQVQSQNASQDDSLEPLREMVPAELVPKAEELMIVGNVPYDWVLFYQISIMHENAMCFNSTSRPRVEELLIEHGFGAFAWTYLTTASVLALLLGSFGLTLWSAFRLRIYGGPEASISLAELLPGAFNPSRVADPDFDPSRQKEELPYRSVKDQVKPKSESISGRLCIFAMALAGVYSSWWLAYVRIPPEKDVLDEEYLSDDDEDARLEVRNKSMAKAKNVQTLEVVLRVVCNGFLVYWLIACARRIGDAFILALLHVCYASVVCITATCAMPAAEPENTGCTTDSDAAHAVCALFGVQQGPRWTRAICTTRSTASPKRNKRVYRRRRKSTSAESGSGNELPEDKQKKEAGMGAEDVSRAVGESASSSAPLPVSFSDRFQQQLLNAGILHIPHGSYLDLSVATLVRALIAIVFLVELRHVAFGSYQTFYERVSPLQIMQAYGSPQSGFRCLALAGELLLMWLCGERLHQISSLLHVGTLSLKQRSAAVNFLREHQPALDAVTAGADAASKHFIELGHCSEFALELSTARWQLLQQPVRLAYVLTETLLLVSLLQLATPLILRDLEGPTSAWDADWLLDPTVPLVLGLVIAWPMITLLIAAYTANAEIHRQRLLVRSQVEVALSASSMNKEEADVKYVQLRIQTQQVMADATLTWENGKELGLMDITLLAFTAAAATGLALLRFFDVFIP